MMPRETNFPSLTPMDGIYKTNYKNTNNSLSQSRKFPTASTNLGYSNFKNTSYDGSRSKTINTYY